MRKHFLKTAMMILVVLAMVGLGMSLTACDDDISVNSPVSYGFAKIQYHYQHDALLEEYWQESYTIQSGQTHQVTTFYTPPMRSGYIFAGWTLETGGAGEVLTTPFSITGAGGGGNIYKLYAKWEPDVSSLTSTNFLHFFDVTTAVTTSVPYTGARTFRARAEVSLKDGINLPSNDIEKISIRINFTIFSGGIQLTVTGYPAILEFDLLAGDNFTASFARDIYTISSHNSYSSHTFSVSVILIA